jgi:hypothetical protein
MATLRVICAALLLVGAVVSATPGPVWSLQWEQTNDLLDNCCNTAGPFNVAQSANGLELTGTWDNSTKNACFGSGGQAFTISAVYSGNVANFTYKARNFMATLMSNGHVDDCQMNVVDLTSGGNCTLFANKIGGCGWSVRQFPTVAAAIVGCIVGTTVLTTIIIALVRRNSGYESVQG